MICPNCNKALDIHVAIGYNDNPPAPGDIIFCAYCRMPLVLEANETLHVMSELEKAILSDSQRSDIEFASRLPKPNP